jgi:hypothetical protein
LLVELPILIDRDGFALIDESFDVWYEGFTSGFDVSADVFTTVCSVVLVLWSLSRCDGFEYDADLP